MEVIDGQWIMEGMDWDDEGCVHTADELLDVIEKVGFLPLFSNRVPGFSVENMTDPTCWWAGNVKRDPWEWRVELTRTGKVAYGKFFGGRAGFISKKWFPYFANYRRDGYDFDARYDDGLAGRREKLIMDLFLPEGMDPDQIKKTELEKNGCDEVLFTNEMKERSGFGKGGEKGFEGTLTKLQMQSYLVTKDFRQRVNKQGETFGWAIAMMTLPEYLWGYDFVTKRYSEKPEESYNKIINQIKKHFDADEKTIRKVL
ncbi:MAG: hypothetical protein J5379_04325 [Clostridiales bacterium]|nr:hypothetical protein [Clostridiales bacterium]